jgi:hypothetical protein
VQVKGTVEKADESSVLQQFHFYVQKKNEKELIELTGLFS